MGDMLIGGGGVGFILVVIKSRFTCDFAMYFCKSWCLTKVTKKAKMWKIKGDGAGFWGL